MGTTGGSSRPSTNGTGHNTFLPWPNPSDSARLVGVEIGGTKTLILRGFSQSLLIKDSSSSSESLPRAETVKVSPCGASGGEWILVKASEKALIPVLDVKAIPENCSRLG